MIDRNCNIGKIRKNVHTLNVQHQSLLKPNQQNKNQAYAQKQSLQQSSYLTKSKMVNNMALSMFSSFAFQNQSLRKYRQKFLGSLSNIQQNARPDFELRAIRIVPKKQSNTGTLVKFTAILENGNEKLFKPKDIIQHVILLQGTLYNFIINFEVSKEILYGVRLINSTYKFGIKMDEKQYKIGSFAPGAHKRSIDVKTPSGFLKRGQYKCQLKIYDQYDECYGICTYSILIAGK